MRPSIEDAARFWRLDRLYVGFEAHHDDDRMVAAFDLRRQIAYVKVIGTHKDYDAVDALTVSLF